MALDKRNSINNILKEKRIFPPSKDFADNSNIKSEKELFSLKKTGVLHRSNNLDKIKLNVATFKQNLTFFKIVRIDSKTGKQFFKKEGGIIPFEKYIFN